MTTFNFRIPDDLYAKVKAAAVQDERSVNSQLLYYVRLAVEQRETMNRPDGDSSSPAPLRGSRHSPRP